MDLKLCPSHDYPLKSTKVSSKCDACYENHHDNKPSYKCTSCQFYVHEECINTNIPSRHKHPLKLTRYERNSRYCFLCQSDVRLWYQCFQCSFSMCVPCERKPLTFNQTKAHEHELHQIPIDLSFTCDACGLCSSYPCVCLQCCFKIHRKCILLPRVININRHDHRISHVSSLGIGNWICGVCHAPVNGEFGAYSCLVCPYVVHSECATSFHVWDGRELEGVPEIDEKEEYKLFEVIDQNLIKHFSHEHLKVSISSTRLEEDALPYEEYKHCYACTFPLYYELCYKCTQCDFVLHDACANLPQKKRHVVNAKPLTLFSTDRYSKDIKKYFICETCKRYCTGFSYLGDGGGTEIDVRCAPISGTFKHESHPQRLFVLPYKRNIHVSARCRGCDLNCLFYLRCENGSAISYDCFFKLCFACATLPTSVRHKYDDHPLFLCYGERNVISSYYCGICEEKIYSKRWFYRCKDCDSTLHTKCVFKNLLHPRLGYSLKIYDEGTFDLLPNNRISRPICYKCKSRCTGDLVLNKKADTNIFLCCSCGFPEMSR